MSRYTLTCSTMPQSRVRASHQHVEALASACVGKCPPAGDCDRRQQQTGDCSRQANCNRRGQPICCSRAQCDLDETLQHCGTSRHREHILANQAATDICSGTRTSDCEPDLTFGFFTSKGLDGGHVFQPQPIASARCAAWRLHATLAGRQLRGDLE